VFYPQVDWPENDIILEIFLSRFHTVKPQKAIVDREFSAMNAQPAQKKLSFLESFNDKVLILDIAHWKGGLKIDKKP